MILRPESIKIFNTSVLSVLVFTVLAFMFSFSVSLADHNCKPNAYDGCVIEGHSGGGGDTSSGNIVAKLNNPLKATSITEFLKQVLDVILIFAVPVVVFFIIFAGFLFVTAQGNQEKLSKAKSALMWAIVGGVLVLGAKVILTVIEGTVKGFQ